MKRIFIALYFCLIASTSLSLGFGQTCRFTCGSGLANDAVPGILRAKGDLGGHDLFKDCVNSCGYTAIENMLLTFFAQTIFYTAQDELNTKAGIDDAMAKLAGENPAQNFKFKEYAENLSIEFIEKASAPGHKEIDKRNRKSSYMGHMLDNNLHPERFEKVLRNQPFIQKYLNHDSDRFKKAGEALIKAIVEKYKELLTIFEKNTDKYFGDNTSKREEDAFKSFQKKVAGGKKEKAPEKSGWSINAYVPAALRWTCANTCSSIELGKKAGEEFNEAIKTGKDPEKTKLQWCQTNCPTAQYERFFCTGFDTLEGDNILKLNETKTRVYATVDNKKYPRRCAVLHASYGTTETANDVGVRYANNMEKIFAEAKKFDDARVGSGDKEKAERDRRSKKKSGRDTDDDLYDEHDDSDIELSEKELEDLLRGA